jgi:hypothetical protein
MRNKDQVLLENAYEQVLNEKGFLPSAALAAIMAIGGTPKDVKAQDMDRAGIESSFTNPELSEQAAFEKLLSDLSNLPVKNPDPKKNEQLVEPPVDKQLLSKVANSKNEVEKQRVTDLIQLKGYKLPPEFGSAREIKTPVGG